MTVQSLTAPGVVRRRLGASTAVACLTALLMALALAPGARAATPATPAAPATTATTTTTTPPPPAQDPFYRYTGATPLAKLAPGTVLKTRTVAFHIAGIATPVTTVQLLYRSTTVANQPTTNVTSVLLPPVANPLSPHLVGYGSFYDSLSSSDEPSYVFAGAPYSSSRQLVAEESAAAIAPLLLAGDTVSVADTEGQNPQFSVGPEYGRLTLDGLRAARNSSATGTQSPATKIALMGYSGGAIATGWAAQLAPSYAPDIESRLVGATLGGVLVEPAHNLHYVSGSTNWAGVIPMALIGIQRAYGVSLAPYLSAYGAQVIAAIQQQGIDQVTKDYPGLTFAQLVKPQYANPDSIPPFVQIANQLILGHAALPKVPLLISQGAGGTADGTSSSQPGIGPGDGVMIAGDVRSYAREACAAGDPVDYGEYDALTHEETIAPWIASTTPWLAARFAGTPAPSDCATIAPGNPLTPVTQVPPGS